MGSAFVTATCGTYNDDHFHVGYDPTCNRWWVVRGDQSYGGHSHRSGAIVIATDAKLSTDGLVRRDIIVHKRGGAVDFTIVKCRGKASPQFFQDSVP